MNRRSCVGNYRFFYFNDDSKLDLSHIQKIYCLWKKTSVLFIEYTEIIWNRKYDIRLCVSTFFIDMGWYLRVIERIHNDEYLTHIFSHVKLSMVIQIYSLIHSIIVGINN